MNQILKKVPVLDNSSNNKNNRYNYIDVIKGIGILLVVFQHCIGGGTLCDFLPIIQKSIAGFHMPLFFFISGWLYTKKDSKEFLSKKMITLVYPYIMIQIINFLFSSSSYIIKRLFLIEGLYPIIKLEGYWFIETLLYVSVIVYLLDCQLVNQIKNQKIIIFIKIIIAFTGLAIGLICSMFMNGYSVILCSLIAIFYFLIGNLVRRVIKINDNPISHKLKSLFILLALIFLAVQIIISNFNDIVTMAKNEYGNPLLFVFSSILGIIAIFLFGCVINKNSILEFFGKNSLIILTTQFPIFRVVLLLLNHFNVIWEDNYNMILCFVLTIVIEIVVIKFINRFFPTFAGKFKY